jgi:GntR family transcriptional repressor for pyruvate dehydrogenase complex
MTRRKTLKRGVPTPRAQRHENMSSPIQTDYAPAARRSMKTSDRVALDIVRDIVARNLQPGDKLPLEAELLKQYKVSRSSLREALRLLEVQSLITIKPGPGGGTVVGKVHPGSLGRSLTLHMHMLGATYDELLNTWVLAEPMLAELAAKNPDRERVRRAMAPFLVKQKPSQQYPHDIVEGLQFHDVISELADNRVLAYLLRTAASIVTEHIVTTIDTKALQDHIFHEHAEIAQLIISGNAKKARIAMQGHIHHVAEYFRAYWPRKVGDKIQWL